MANDYFTHDNPLSDHTTARAPQVNSIASAIEGGFDKLPAPDALREGRFSYLEDTGAADAYVVAFSTAPSGYTEGMSFVFQADNANTGASTINVNSLGVKSIKRYNGDALSANDIVAGMLVQLAYDGTNFRIVGAHGASETNAAASATAAASSASAAATSETNAATSATNASNSASAAATSATAAQTAETNAETAQTAAESARDQAQTAQTAAETAETNAVTAQTAAEAAQTAAEAAAAKLQGTSTSSVAIGSGSKTFTTQSGKFFDVGYFLLIASDADEGNYMTGQVTAYSGTSLTVDVTHTGGSGTFADWSIFVVGRPGAPGTGTLQPFVGLETTGLSQTLNASASALDFNNIDTVDTGNFHDPSVNSTEIAFSTDWDGYYFDFDCLISVANSGTDLVIKFTITGVENGTTYYQQSRHIYLATYGDEHRFYVSFLRVPIGNAGGFGVTATIEAQVLSGPSSVICTGKRLNCMAVAAPVGANTLVFPSYTNASRPAATAVQAGTAIWNTDDGFPNWSNGTNWVTADGTTT